ncbi:hypothetical protein V7128_01950 [Neobacillus vireti]|uniref:hypothetical protein n=1 Tax=Neobacillus vireti TaxID=220686 RepID=UPI002FFD90C4
MSETKICVDCNEEKELTEFYSQRVKKKDGTIRVAYQHTVNHAQVKGYQKEITKTGKSICNINVNTQKNTWKVLIEGNIIEQ